ncbi:carbohydrate ABC transporter permease [Curtobacterium sp. MCBD17_034]|uniref:carbohydrate ABC transporter permease n=1 Tax=unclassified Curtobacterium TaxID=257496 RepID=UPI000DA9CE83|nr:MULTISPECIES: carbohydrate ABC transporter permease [unclassified Curtobacterium]PZE74819.1 carbohydrate ABC transporter permease [Curtobacterium sp. MCBD17_019]PZF60448.1 carbohydrate ABC transporter permease [Curtobacterium sp. MCBD17_034]PZF62829.1 carbohydrate ABC transporter permease [Curtobacterium sp. MCBD17_013]PZM35138.1 carbohydrate ABC transporter permease [Curtobacterium sp. MCBD17_031]
MSTKEKVFRYVLLVVVLFITIGPFLWQLSTSLKGAGEDIYTQTPEFVPSQPTFLNYVKVADAIPVFTYIGNSLVVAALDVVGNVVFATLAGFAVARLQFRGKKVVLGLFLATLVLPGEVTIVSQFVTIKDLGLADSLVGVALPGMIAALNVLLMYNAFRQIPEEIDQAAVMDGANSWQRLRFVALPAVQGTIAVIAIFSFIGAWDDFLWPLIVLQTPDKLTLTVGLQYLQGTFSNDQRLIAAGTMIAFIPIAVIFSVLQRFFFKGVEEGGVKG